MRSPSLSPFELREMDSNSNTEEIPLILLPERPIEPLDSECCGTGCTPCVFDIFEKQLSKWKKDCKEILRTGVRNEDLGENADISPYNYKDFEIVDISIDLNAPSVKIFRLNCFPKDCPTSATSSVLRDFPVNIGQHVVLKIGVVSRKYTVLRVNDNNTFDILVKIYSDGPMTQLIHKLTVGDCVQTRGPFGDTLKYEPNQYKNVVMLAGGTGFAPMYRIIETILQNEEDDTRINLFFASKTLEDIFLRQKLKEWSDFWNFEVLYFLSAKEEEVKVKVPYGMKVDFQRLSYEYFCKHFENGFQSLKTFYFICGTKSFEKDMVNYLTKLGADNKNMLVF